MEQVPTPLRPPLSNSSSPRDNEPDFDDVEKLREWQHGRIEKKLRGEYESYVSHLSELMRDNLSTPLRVSRVRIEGADNTRKCFLGMLVNPVISPFSENRHTLGSVLHAAKDIAGRLQQTDIFKSVEMRLERSRDPLAQEEDVDIVAKTREKGRFYLKTATEVGNGEGNASVTGHIRNVFGGAETLEAHLSLGTATRRSFSIDFTAPLDSTLQTRGELSVFGMERDHTSFASSMEGLRGVRAVVRNGSTAQGSHAFMYEAVLRHVAGLTPTASFSIREAAGDTLKSSLSHSWIRDTRDDKISGNRGHFFKLYHEFAGLGGSVSFYKTEAETQLSRQLLPGVTISSAARMGLLWPMGNKPSSFPDRFQLGGPTSVRSFRANGLGPKDGADSLGGDIYWGLGTSLISDIPSKPHWPVKAHAFINAGRLDFVNRSRSVRDNITDCLSRPSISAGLGLIYRFDPVRVEVNLGVPLVASPNDRVRRGVQVGMGLEFL